MLSTVRTAMGVAVLAAAMVLALAGIALGK